jgi:hypothetical protein
LRQELTLAQAGLEPEILLLQFFLFFSETGSHYAIQDGLKLMILLPQPPS